MQFPDKLVWLLGEKSTKTMVFLIQNQPSKGGLVKASSFLLVAEDTNNLTLDTQLHASLAH